jgi:hypothetical protein
MGWKCSLIIIENQDDFKDDISLLKAIGMSDYEFDSECTLDDCIYPMDQSISIGYFNGNIIISDDYQLTTSALDRAKNLSLTASENGLVNLFPSSEIVTVACHSGVNYHGYSLIRNGIKERLKTISSDDARKEFGTPFKEEQDIYATSYLKDGLSFWKDDNDPDAAAEDVMMEKFTFEVAKRRLGVILDNADGEKLLFEVPFKKYVKKMSEVNDGKLKTIEKRTSWIKYGLIVLIILIWQILKRTVFSK